MSCLRLSAKIPVNEQVRVAVSPRPQASACPPYRSCFSRSISFAAKKQWLQPAECAPFKRQQVLAQEDGYSGILFVELINAILRDIKNGLMYLFEQPRELQYLEFPSLQSAAKMAIFTIAVVMVLIVFLATVDSAFSYITATMFRRIK